MQNMEQNTSENGMLSDADLDAINGGNIIGDIFRAIGSAAEFVGGLIWNGLHGQPGPWRGPFGPRPL